MSPFATIPGWSRRSFLGGAGVAGLTSVALAQSPRPPATGRPLPKMEEEPPLPEAEKLGFAIVGLGKLALEEVLPAFAASRACKLAALVSGSPEKARRVAAMAGLPDDAIYDYAGFDRIAQDPRIDIVYIILPNALHAEYTIRALKAGKHVLCEKPMATSVADCEAMIKAAADAKRKLMVAYRAQYEPHNLEAMRLVRTKAIGDVRMVVTGSGRPADPQDPADQWRLDKALAGGGPLMDIGIYGINGARYLTGEEPVELRAWTHKDPDDPRFRQVEDVLAWQLRFPSGAIANGSTAYSYAETSHLEVIGTKGRIVMDPATNYRGLALRVRLKGEETRPQIAPIDQFAREMDHFALAVKNDTPVTTPGEEGMQDVRLMLALYEAARTGKPVSVDWRYRRAVDPAAAAEKRT